MCGVQYLTEFSYKPKDITAYATVVDTNLLMRTSDQKTLIWVTLEGKGQGHPLADGD